MSKEAFVGGREGLLVARWSSVLKKRPSHGKLKLATSFLQTQVGVCERRKNCRQTS